MLTAACTPNAFGQVTSVIGAVPTIFGTMPTVLGAMPTVMGEMPTVMNGEMPTYVSGATLSGAMPTYVLGEAAAAPNWLGLVVGLGLIGGVLYFGFKARSNYIPAV